MIAVEFRRVVITDVDAHRARFDTHTQRTPALSHGADIPARKLTTETKRELR